MKLGPIPRSMPVADAVARNVNTRSDRHKQCENWRRDPTTFSFTVERAGERPLTRQMREAQKIANEAPGRLINGRYEHIPPAIRPLTPGHLMDREAMRGAGQ